jgi:glycogen debranching enzyme
LSATPEEVYAKLDAAFNGDVFSWDDMLVALGTIAVHPWLVKSTIEFWLDVQKMNGGAIPREVRKSNLLSLWFADIVRPGEKTKPNLNYANPYLMNWVAERLYAYDPSPENAKLLLRVVKSIADYSKWMKKTRSVYDSEGKFLGFSTNALASGLDNSRGGRGNDHAPEAYQTAWVDTLAQHVAMLKSVVRWNEMFIEKDLPKLSAKYIELIKDEIKSDETLLNTKYYDKDLKFHFDLIPDGKGGHRRDTAYHSIAGFFPFFSASVSPEQAREIVALQLSPERFGGTFPLPANSRHAIRLEENNDGYWHLDARWPSMAVIVVEGLKRSGMRQAAFDMAVGFLKGMTEASTKTVYEFYGLLNKLSDSGQKGRPGQESGHTTRVDFAGWGKVPPIYMMLETVIGLEPQFNGELHWNVMFKMESGEKVEVANYMYRGRLIKKLTLRKTESGKLVVDIDQGNSLGPGASDGPIDIKIFDLYSGN